MPSVSAQEAHDLGDFVGFLRLARRLLDAVEDSELREQLETILASRDFGA